jgi:hypothetical protein
MWGKSGKNGGERAMHDGADGGFDAGRASANEQETNGVFLKRKSKKLVIYDCVENVTGKTI